jgi:hypothetical protein
MPLRRRSLAALAGTGLALALLGAPPATADQAAPAAHHGGDRSAVTYPIPGDAVFPEGVATDPRSSAFYVGSTTDGTVYRGDVRGGPMQVFLPGGADGRTSVTGMKVDGHGRLYVAGAGTGRIFVYDTATGRLVRRFDNGHSGDTFLNDIAFDRWGNAYVTDSLTPVLWRVPVADLHGDGIGATEPFLSLDGTPAAYQPGFNLNGIVAVDGGRALVSVASNTGKLFRIDLSTRDVTEIPVAGGPLTAGDGMLVADGRLLVVRNQFELVVSVALHRHSARVVGEFTDPSFVFPTTVAARQGRLLVVNSQFDHRNAGVPPELPFSVSGVPLRAVVH